MADMIPYRILHIITDLNMGGAEMALHNLLTFQDRTVFSSEVISLTTADPVGRLISELDVPVIGLGMRPGVPDARMITRLQRRIRSWKPHLVQTWMYHADLAGGLAAVFPNPVPVVWGLHHTISGPEALKPATFAVARLNAILSRFLPAKIVCCAEATLQTHVQLGYQASKMTVIPNGINLDKFRPDPEARREVRDQLDVDDQTPLIGLCARFDPQKDHRNFIRAAAALARTLPAAHFVLWGSHVDERNESLAGWIRESALEGRVHLLGLRMDSHRIMAALDIASLSSAYGEAFPLVLGEAMACGVPCVATRIGDAASLIGSTGRTVPPGDPAALAAAWMDILQMDQRSRQGLGRSARQRIEADFSIGHMVRAYEQVHYDIISSRKVQP